ncbi:hypothetical protein ACJ41O_014878 [Fusarium nematophilum]
MLDSDDPKVSPTVEHGKCWRCVENKQKCTGGLVPEHRQWLVNQVRFATRSFAAEITDVLTEWKEFVEWVTYVVSTAYCNDLNSKNYEGPRAYIPQGPSGVRGPQTTIERRQSELVTFEMYCAWFRMLQREKAPQYRDRMDGVLKQCRVVLAASQVHDRELMALILDELSILARFDPTKQLDHMRFDELENKFGYRQ